MLPLRWNRGISDGSKSRHSENKKFTKTESMDAIGILPTETSKYTKFRLVPRVFWAR